MTTLSYTIKTYKLSLYFIHYKKNKPSKLVLTAL